MALSQFFLKSRVPNDFACRKGLEVVPHESGPFKLELEKDDLHHARALRLTPGERIAVIDSASDYYVCEIVAFEDGVPLVRIASRKEAPANRVRVTLIQGIPKGEKMVEIVRQGTELGISSFIPLLCERSVPRFDAKKREAKRERWQAVAKSAAMQSGARRIPQVENLCTVDELCACSARFTVLLIFWEECEIDVSLRDVIESTGNLESAEIALVIGPEGGLSPEEVASLCSANANSHVLGLGSSILRTQTAGVIAPALVLYELGYLR